MKTMNSEKLLLARLTGALLIGVVAATSGIVASNAFAQGSQPETPKEAPKDAPKTDAPAKTEPPAKKDDTKAPPAGDAKNPAAPTAKETSVFVHMKTSMGDIVLELDPVKAPISAANFVKYADQGFYDGTIFHRVIPGFMIQGGGMTPDMKEKRTDAPITNEWKNGLKNTRGTLAMARKGAGPDSPNSATSQFFINTKDNGFLDRAQPDGAAYAVFGKVLRGMEVVDAIERVKTGTKNPHSDVPLTPVMIEKVKVVTKEEAEKVTTK